MDAKTYLIGDVECKLKELSLDDMDKLRLITSGFNTLDNQTITSNLTSDQTKELLLLILEPVKSKDVIDIGKIKASLAPKIVLDFFFLIIMREQDITNYSIQSMKQLSDLIKEQKT